MIKAIFFDIDGTLIASNGKALASTREAIKQAQANGVLCGIATGRGPVDLEKVIDYLSLDMFITYNGQYVYTKENLIYAKPFPKQTLEAIVEYADENYRQVMFGGATQVAGSLTIRLSQSPVMQRYLRYVPKKFPVGFLKKVLQRFSPNRNAKRYESLDILREPIYQCIMILSDPMPILLTSCRKTVRKLKASKNFWPMKGSRWKKRWHLGIILMMWKC